MTKSDYGLLVKLLTEENVVGSVELVVAAGDPAVVDLSVDLDVQVLADPVDLDGVPAAVVDLDLRGRDCQLCEEISWTVSLLINFTDVCF